MPKRKLIDAAGYARRSTDLQERSIPDQQAYVEKWAGDNGYRIVRWFIDDAISGTSAKGRNAFEQMIATAENGRDFETILCYDISRFSRGGTNETGYYLHRLRLAGVDVLFTADGIPDGDEGELIQGVKSWQARQYSVKLARDTIRGQISNIRERKSAPGGVAPYGYDKQHLTADGKVLRTLRWMPDGSKQEFGPDGKLLRVIEPGVNIKKAKSDIVKYVPSTPERVAVIKRMFELCVQGYGCHTIAAELNSEGIPSPGGQKWNTARIAKLLRNPVYKGAIAWNRHTMGSLFGLDGNGVLKPKKQRGWKRNSQADWIISEDVHEPLVPPETWEAAQKAMAKRHVDGGKSRPTNRSLLASLMTCNRCQHNFVQRRDRRWPGPNGDGYRYYSCSGYHRYGKSVCGLTNLPGPALDAFVVQAIQRVLLGDHDSTKAAVEAFVKAVLAPTKASKRSKASDRELDLLNRKIKATVAMLADPAFDGLDELRTTLADLKAKRDALAARMKPADQPAAPAITADELRRWALEQFSRLDDIATKPTVDLQDRQLVEAFVQRIEINPETKTGEVILIADLANAFREGSTRVPIGDLRGTGETRPGDYRGRRSYATGLSSSLLMFNEPLVGGRLSDLLHVINVLRAQLSIHERKVSIWGDSFAKVNSSQRIAVPLGIDEEPAHSEPLGPLLSLLAALFDEDIQCVVSSGGLVSNRSVLDSQFVHVPHDWVIPRALTAGDLVGVARYIAPRAICLTRMVDGTNRYADAKSIQAEWQSLSAAYGNRTKRLSIVAPKDFSETTITDWLTKHGM